MMVKTDLNPKCRAAAQLISLGHSGYPTGLRRMVLLHLKLIIFTTSLD